MNTKTIQDIRNQGPCYNPTRHLPADWQGTALDILRVNACPPQDRLWVVLAEDWLDSATLRRFACYCARQTLALTPNPDVRILAALEVAERHAVSPDYAALVAARQLAYRIVCDSYADKGNTAAQLAANTVWAATAADALDAAYNAHDEHLTAVKYIATAAQLAALTDLLGGAA